MIGETATQAALPLQSPPAWAKSGSTGHSLLANGSLHLGVLFLVEGVEEQRQVAEQDEHCWERPDQQADAEDGGG